MARYTACNMSRRGMGAYYTYKPSRPLCVTCETRRPVVVFLPCSHVITCVTCADEMEQCALCQRNILGTVVTEPEPEVGVVVDRILKAA